jgi:DNA-binding response OmpR family regulator
MLLARQDSRAGSRGEHSSVTFEPLAEPLTILIVDDDARVRRALARCLELDGHVVDIADSGSQALRLIDARPWDLLCLDAQLPDIPGSVLAPRLQLVAQRAYTVLVTGFASSLDDGGLLTAGIDAVLPKPWKVDELESVLQRAREHVAARGRTRAA